MAARAVSEIRSHNVIEKIAERLSFLLQSRDDNVEARLRSRQSAISAIAIRKNDGWRLPSASRDAAARLIIARAPLTLFGESGRLDRWASANGW